MQVTMGKFLCSDFQLYRPLNPSSTSCRSSSYLITTRSNARRTSKIRIIPKAAAFDADLSEQVSGQGKLNSPLQIALGLGVLLGYDRVLATSLQQWPAFPAAATNLPSSTLGMISIASLLVLLDRFSPPACRSVNSFFAPTLQFVQRWMPLFYAPALAMLPMSCKDLQIVEGFKIVILLVLSWAATLSFTSLWSMLIRRYVKNARLEEAPSMNFGASFSIWETLPWLALGAIGFMAAYVSPTGFSSPAKILLPFLLSATVVGFLLGSFLPAAVKRFVHPVITCAIFVNAAALFYSIAAEKQFVSVLGLYFTNSLKDPGAGDVLMAFLGPLAMSYGFLLYRQRRIILRHAVDLTTVVPLAGLFSLLATSQGGRLLGLGKDLSNAVSLSSLTFAFALPSGNSLQANPSLVATCCILTGLLGANLSKPLLSKVDDLVVRGLAASCSSHGYGSASVAAGEADLLPLCAVSYVLMGAFCSLVCSTLAAVLLRK